jgi:hypothetical protein
MTSSNDGQSGLKTASPPGLPPSANDEFTAVKADVTMQAQPVKDLSSSSEPVLAPEAPPENPSAIETGMSTANTTTNGNGESSTIKTPILANVSMDIDPLPTQFPNTPIAQIDHHAYMMMALAQASAVQMSPPPTVTPSQVTLPGLLSNGNQGRGAGHNQLHPGFNSQRLESFARIEFADSVFQMTTYAVIIGRDQSAMEQARKDERRAEEYNRLAKENASKGLPPPSPIPRDRGKFSKSYVSEEGGMLGPESDGSDNPRPAKRRKTSTAGSSGQHEGETQQDGLISNRQYVSHTPGAAAVDLSSLRPSPYHVPFIGIHSPGPNIATKTKAISREHLRIEFNQEQGVFEAIPLHPNGFFLEDVHYKQESVVLRSGDRLQIKDVDFVFVINGVERGNTGAEEYFEEEAASSKRYSEGGKEMSFEFEQSHAEGDVQDTSDELSDIELSAGEQSDEDDEDDEEQDNDAEDDSDAEEDEEEDDEDAKDEPEPEPEPLPPPPPKKRGPGRPPKNGIMSKREQRLLKKQQQEMAKKTLPQPPPGEPPVKRKVGRPRKHPLPESAGEKPEKRKYKPRKPKNEDGAEGSDGERRKEKKEKKSRPKSPPLELKIEDFTEEQLQKPNKNYGVLIDETLTAAGPDGLTLRQIYKRICQKYPWFYFHTGTKGWESSVRHNLIGNEAFKKDETTGCWSRLPGIELDAGKKRKAASPDRNLAAQGYGQYPHAMYQSYPGAAAHMVPGAPGYPAGMVPPNYQMPGQSNFTAQKQGTRPAQPYTAVTGTQAAGQASQSVTTQPPAPAQLPGYGPPAVARPQLGGPPTSTYSSPYASRPPPSAATIKTEESASSSAQQIPPASAIQTKPPVVPGASASTPAGVQQTAPASTAKPLSSTPPAPSGPRYVIEPRLLASVVTLKNGLIDNLKKARNPMAMDIVMSAVNRCFGLKTSTTDNVLMEDICLKGIRQVLVGFVGENNIPTDPTAPVPVIDATVLSSLVGFRTQMVQTLKAKLGEAKVETLVLSAIDRVIGLADSSIAVAREGTESTGNFEAVEQQMMKSVRMVLNGVNQRQQGA